MYKWVLKENKVSETRKDVCATTTPTLQFTYVRHVTSLPALRILVLHNLRLLQTSLLACNESRCWLSTGLKVHLILFYYP